MAPNINTVSDISRCRSPTLEKEEEAAMTTMTTFQQWASFFKDTDLKTDICVFLGY